jgi:hypothetical protein
MILIHIIYRFFSPEYVHPKEASAIIAAPREGTGVCSFRRPKYQPYSQRDASPSSPKRKKQKTATAGRTEPHPDVNLLKYSTDTDHMSRMLDMLTLSGSGNIVHNNPLLNAAYAKSTWSKHMSSINSYLNFCQDKEISEPWPITLDYIKDYILWATFDKNLTNSTVKNYMSSLSTCHTIMGHPTDVFEHPIVILMLRGAKNTEISNYKPTRKIITIPILKLIGHEIANLPWSDYSKQVYWACCCTAFFGSTRMCELLSEQEHKFDPSSTLTWNDVKFEDDKILLHIKNPKISTSQGDFIDLYMYKDSSYCPFSCMLNLKNMTVDSELYKSHNPVFSFANGRNLTSKNFNPILQKLLFPHLGMAAYEYSGHSFRPALPSYMAMFPELISKEEIKAQGHWKSSVFELYTRLKKVEKKKLFEKIMLTL